MKILQINKFLYNVGGAETYMFKLSEALIQNGHEVKFWGMQHEKNLVNDEFNCFAENIDFKSLSPIRKLKSVQGTIYSFKNVKKIERFLDNWTPDIAHIHNYNFQLTPSILKVLKKRKIKVVQTVHDSQMVCPYHRLYNFQKKSTCTKCVEGSFMNCLRDRCFDNSLFKSSVGVLESYLYHSLNYYNKYIDYYISPSNFLKKLISKRVEKTIAVIPNFVDFLIPRKDIKIIDNRNSYYLYYGRISPEKGILDIIPFFESLKIQLVIVGNGEDADKINNTKYIKYLGPKYGDELHEIIYQAKYVIQPSKWFENCPMTIVESYSLGVPVIGANHSGFLELIKDGETGFLIDFSEAKDIEQQILRIEKSYSKELKTKAFNFYLDFLSKREHVNQIEKVYQLL